MGRLEGRTCLIVGGTGGIGLATARRFLEEGARVLITGHLTDALEAALSALHPTANDRVRGVVVELQDPASVAALFETALPGFAARLDVLVHVAGISGRRFGDGPLHACSDEGWSVVQTINAQGAFRSNRAAVRRMRAQPPDELGLRGTILNVGSVLDRAPSPRHFGTIAYAASKGAVRALTLAAAAAYAAEKIRVNLIEPGLVDSPMAARAVGDEALRPYLGSKQPLASGPVSVEDVAEAALYLASPESRSVTGAVLTVDGGWSLSEGQISGQTAP